MSESDRSRNDQTGGTGTGGTGTGGQGTGGATGYRGAARRGRAGTATSGTGEASTGGGTGRDGTGSGPHDTRKVHSERVRKLGEGSYGDVWLVEYLGALEAHKFLRPGARRDAFREAVNTRTVDHPHVVKVIDVIEEDELPTLRMEFVEGRDLKRVVEDEGVFSVERVLPIAIQIADALQATHERGIVHLDLKPSNMILRDDGKNVVVTDFGISAALRPEDGGLQGGHGGTPYFMAPELHDDDGRGSPGADIWSLGISLYYLVSGTYPFPFDAMVPREAVREEPNDLSASHRYVSSRFFDLLKKMISVDPDARFASMAEVKQSLEDYAFSVACSLCGQLVPIESNTEVCPNPDCQSRLVAPIKSAVRARRAAFSALAECSFDLSGSEARRAREELAAIDGCGEQVEELDSFLEAIPGLKEEHDAAVAVGRELFGQEKYIDAILRVSEAACRYSHSEEVRSLRRELRETFASLYRSTAERVRERIRSREFEAARAELSQMDHILGDDVARRELAAGIDGDLRDFAWLHDEINTQQKDFQKYQAAGREAILNFDFKGAMEAWTRLDTSFPSEESQTLLSALGRAGPLFETQRSVSPQGLQTIVADPAKANEAEFLRYEEAGDACGRLLEDFPPDRFPSFTQIQEKAVLLEQASAAIRTFVETVLAGAESAREKQELREENRQLRTIREILSRSDLFDSRTQSLVDERLRATERSASEADRLYQEGKSAFAAREFSRALAALREVERIAPGSYPDTEELLEKIGKSLDEVRDLRGEVTEGLARIDRGDFDLAFAVEMLRKTEQLHGLVEERERGKLSREMADGCSRLLDDQRDYLEKEFAAAGDQRGARLAGFLEENTIPVVAALPGERWHAILHESKECNRSLCEFFAAIRPDGALPFADWVGQVEPIVGVMEQSPFAAILKSCAPPKGAEHPSVDWGSVLLEAYGREPVANKDRLFPQADGTLARLVALCPSELRPQTSLLLDTLRKGGRQATFWSRCIRARDFVRNNVWVCVAAVAAGIVCYFVGKGAGESQSLSWVAGEVARLELPSEPVEASLSEWIQEGGQGKNAIARIRLLGAWQDLQNAREAEVSATRRASLVGNAVNLRPILAERAGVTQAGDDGSGGNFATLLASLDSEISRNTWFLLDDMLRDAHEMISGGVREGEGVIAVLSLRLTEVHRLVKLEELNNLRVWIDAISAAVEDRIRLPISDPGRWKEFRPGEVLGQLDDLPSLLEREGERDLREAVRKIVKAEIRRAMIGGLKQMTDRALDGNLEGFDEVVAAAGRELGSFADLDAVESKGTRGTLSDAVRWVNEFGADF